MRRADRSLLLSLVLLAACHPPDHRLHGLHIASEATAICLPVMEGEMIGYGYTHSMTGIPAEEWFLVEAGGFRPVLSLSPAHGPGHLPQGKSVLSGRLDAFIPSDAPLMPELDMWIPKEEVSRFLLLTKTRTLPAYPLFGESHVTWRIGGICEEPFSAD